MSNRNCFFGGLDSFTGFLLNIIVIVSQQEWPEIPTEHLSATQGMFKLHIKAFAA